MNRHANTIFPALTSFFPYTGSYDGRNEALHSALRRKRDLLRRLRVPTSYNVS